MSKKLTILDGNEKLKILVEIENYFVRLSQNDDIVLISPNSITALCDFLIANKRYSLPNQITDI